MEDPGELYWNTPPHNSMATKTNKLGRYLHDYRRGSEDFEWIELAKNIKAEDLANNLEVWCDNYDGPGPVAFTAVIVDQGKVIASLDLAISGKGDGRRESDSRESSSSWLRLPVETMLKPAAD